VVIPGFNIHTAPVQNIDLPWELAQSASYSGFNCGFYVDSDMRMRQFFEMWMGLIYNQSEHSMGWYSDYATDATVYVLNKGQVPVYSYRVEQVYPRSLGGTEMTHSSNDVFMELNVDFAFHFVVNDVVQGQRDQSSGITGISSPQSSGNAAPKAESSVSWIVTPNTGTPMTFVMPGESGQQNSMLGSIKSSNSWIDQGFNTAGSIYSMYNSVNNTMNDITGKVKQAKELANAVKTGKSVPGLLNAGISAGVLAERTLKNNPFGKLF
jgi:hypothetical protein